MTVTNTIKSAASDTRITTDELEQILEDGTTPSGEATTELKQVLPKFVDALAPDAREELRLRENTLGVSFAPPPDLRNATALQQVWAGAKTLSASKNSNDPAVIFIQRALMRIAVAEKNPEFGLPKFGADGSFGTETAAAVRAFQRSARVTEDGIVGKNTVAQLELALKGRASELNSLRFKDSPELQAIMDGKVPALGSGSKGEAVKIVQRVLVDLGYPLPLFGVDGGLGKETVYALKQFQADKNLPATGRADTATLVAMDKVAPEPGTRATLKPEYQRMLRDGVLPMMIAVGFDEDASDIWVRQEVKAGLAQRGFKPLAVATMSDSDLQKLGINPSLVDRTSRYYFKKATFQGKTTPVLIKYVDQESASPKAEFARGLVKSAVPMYAGHARYGSGPDFDIKESTAQNFVIGVNAAGHKNGTLISAYDAHMREILKNSPNDLEKTQFEDNYQMPVFFGCSTMNYLDELRAVPQGKSAKNFDTVTSNDLLYWNKMPENVFTMLDGLLGGETKNQLEDRLFAVNNVSFTFDGFGGNPA